jgi:hypothetical protein
VCILHHHGLALETYRQKKRIRLLLIKAWLNRILDAGFIQIVVILYPEIILGNRGPDLEGYRPKRNNASYLTAHIRGHFAPPCL